MSETARAMLELVATKGWANLSREQQQLFNDWMLHGHGVDLYMLLRHARRVFSRGPPSSSATFDAMQEAAAAPTNPPPKGEKED